MTEAEFRWEHNRNDGRREAVGRYHLLLLTSKLEDLLAAKL